MAVEAATPLFEPLVLAGRTVRLEPLTPEHLPALTAAGSDPAIFRYYPVDFSGISGMKLFFDDAFRTRDQGSALPFAVIAAGEPVGSTRFGNIERQHRRAEIGWTWLTPRVQRSAVNTEMKYLMREPRVRDPAADAGRIQDRFFERTFAPRTGADRCGGGGYFPQPHGRAARPHPELGVFQHYRSGLAVREDMFAAKACA